MELNVRCSKTELQKQIDWTLAAVRLDIPFNLKWDQTIAARLLDISCNLIFGEVSTNIGCKFDQTLAARSLDISFSETIINCKRGEISGKFKPTLASMGRKKSEKGLGK
ncbi:hypothetical protein DPMN_169259 [Dreissena polymorpha]|uniref:Uncharacterized protein n=1 Tax=Dreissena polymorpha TaxID=45954 RepID=A0A9D4F3D7_DREPO|nr:hypothetical protein DPMN_169259 [Dreissena polymorpha]